MAKGAAARVRRRIRVGGIVQGVGYRPFVHSLAARYGLGGLVGNDAEGVFIEVEGDSDGALAQFVGALRTEAPPLAVVESVWSEPVPAVGETSFVIVTSREGGAQVALVSPDVATCPDCLAEVRHPAARRYRYPFTNCTNCGPRFTITRGVPYDRPLTTMAGFAMCDECAAEYHDPADRRFHAQPVCCPRCGPSLTLSDRTGGPIPGDPLAETARLLRQGAVIAIKGLGGYHLAARADDEGAVAALRSRKHREDKPFAVMVADLAGAERLCAVDRTGAALLQSPARPIVLLAVREGSPVAPSVAPGNRSLGLMLPYTPLHHLLVEEVGAPFVLTSGNVADEPIAYQDGDAFERLGGIADAFLAHDRPIHIRTDDSVTRPFRGAEMVLRRSRGYAPRSLRLPWKFPRPVLATGAELKNTFCVAKGHHAFVSHHIGDLENYETFASFTEGIEHFCRLFDVDPEVVAHDLHPEYLSTKYAHDRESHGAGEGPVLVGVQHHHAHIASCLADNGETGPVLGVAFDGLGWGPDGTIWGGEFLVADLGGYERVGHLAPVPMPGGTAAIREPWRMAAAYLGDDAPAALRDRHEARWAPVLSLARSGRSSPLTSSAGRLFDAVAAVVGVRDAINYEGQAAVELEQRADRAEPAAHPMTVEDGPVLRLVGRDLVAAAAAEVADGVPVPTVAARFHNGLAAGVVDACGRLRDRHGLATVALSGGVFQNLLLLGRVVDGLVDAGFRVLVHSRVPPNDGGISLGQAAVAGARDRGATSS